MNRNQSDLSILYARLGQSLRQLQDSNYQSRRMMECVAIDLSCLDAELNDLTSCHSPRIPSPKLLNDRPHSYLAPDGSLKTLRPRKITSHAIPDSLQDLMQLDRTDLWKKLPRSDLAGCAEGKWLTVSEQTLDIMQKARACKRLTPREETLVNHPDLFDDEQLKSYPPEELQHARAIVLAIRGRGNEPYPEEGSLPPDLDVDYDLTDDS